MNSAHKFIVAFGLGVIAAGLGAYALLSRPIQAPAVVARIPPPAIDAPSQPPQPESMPAPVKRPRPAHTAKPKAEDTPEAPGGNVIPPAPAPVPAPVVPAVPPPAATAPEESTPPPPPVAQPAQPRVPRTALIPAGTLITVRLNESLTSDHTETGYNFRATLEQPLISQNLVVAERGTVQIGRVVDSEKGGRGPKARSSLSLELTELNTADGQKIPIQTETFVHQGETPAKWREAAKVGAGAAIGAAIGAIIGGGKGAAIGAGAGGAAGAGTVLMTKSSEAKLPAETRITFRLKEPVTLTEKLD